MNHNVDIAILIVVGALDLINCVRHVDVSEDVAVLREDFDNTTIHRM